ncbi:hypothetical protein [Proteiniphilum sp. X52]|uniref:hypothetical protein n=1 Tax=Proteiniphilum sp. X52 TaxID=2382159 RepID=UPI000F09D960|nr:hypothetical protein [Proteiniphilum sp. X52]RNC64973.1 hypothetical protein D7D25_08730 [Proteiniphilum sp. X52]
MNRIYICLMLLPLFSCTGGTSQKQTGEHTVAAEKQSKLERLMQLPRDSVIDYFDLSYDSISDFPDLSDYAIKSLDLSNNRLDTVIVDYLPREIVTLNLSYNSFHKIFEFDIDPQWQLTERERRKLYDKATIREIDLSHNRLTGIDIGFSLRKIIVSHNDITYINFSHGNIQYIDISYNPNLSNVVQFDPYVIDTVIRDHIANDKKLIPSNWFPEID